MALDIVLTVNKKIPTWNQQTSIWFDDAADYWYLYDTMIHEIRVETGEFLDLYGDCKFIDSTLHTLQRLVLKHLALLRQRKDISWPVKTSTQLRPVKEDIFKTLVKPDLDVKLSKFLILIQSAIDQNEMLVGRGD